MTDRPETVSEVCDAAADFIETHGWHQGDLTAAANTFQWLPGTPVCAYGGILGVCGDLGERSTTARTSAAATGALQALTEALGLPPVGSGTGIGDWNDDPSRTQAEVVQALRDTATKHRDDAMRVLSAEPVEHPVASATFHDAPIGTAS